MSHLTARRSIANTRARAQAAAYQENLALIERQKAQQRTSNVTEKCWTCNQHVDTDGNIQPVQCGNCKQRATETAVEELRRSFANLRQRMAAFAYVTSARRDAILCELGFGKPFILADVCELSDDDLIGIATGCASEIERRAMQVEMSPAARRALEQHVIDTDADERADADRFDYSMQ